MPIKRSLFLSYEFRKRHGLVLLALKDFEHALEDFDEAIRITPRDVQAHVGRGQVYEALRDRASAIADYKKAIELKAITILDLDDKDAQTKRKRVWLSWSHIKQLPPLSQRLPLNAAVAVIAVNAHSFTGLRKLTLGSFSVGTYHGKCRYSKRAALKFFAAAFLRVFSCFWSNLTISESR